MKYEFPIKHFGDMLLCEHRCDTCYIALKEKNKSCDLVFRKLAKENNITLKEIVPEYRQIEVTTTEELIEQ